MGLNIMLTYEVLFYEGMVCVCYICHWVQPSWM